MMTLDRKKTLLASTAVALSIATAGAMPAHAKPKKAAAGAPASKPKAAAPEAEEVRLVPMGASERKGNGHGSIRPFAGGILPNAGNIRTFAGDITGSAGNIRTFAGNIRTFAGTGAPMAGNIRTFAGNIRTFAGNIRTFSGEVNPLGVPDPAFWGDLKPLAGSLTASGGNIRTFAGEFEAYAGNIRTFAGNIRTFAGNIRTFEEAPDVYTGMQGEFRALVDGSRSVYGPAVEARTGKSFSDGFANAMLAKYGIDLNDPRSLVGLHEVGVELFLMDWYDNLNNYSGQDQVDHWMKRVGWSPALTQSLGNGADTKIGILDFGLTGDEASNVTKYAGYTGVSGVHGSAVASLIVGKHDGRGVMGIAPNASVISYNPFDWTNTAGWTDIKNGVKYLLDNGASVVNMSLGVPGYALHSGWNDTVFREKAISDKAKKAVFVIAAGNEGVVHPKAYEVNWNFDQNPNIIIVGSIDPNGTISAFSNRPGEGKFKKLAGNDPLGTDMLRDRFIVAPGEFMLVSDGQGGVTRMSGTSFAAPLVSGTIALVHDRWPWLADNPVDTVNLILNSTTDLGAPGTDDVYGRGMLNVQRALEPNNFWALQWKQVRNGVTTNMTAASVLASSQATMSSWEANSVYFSVFEDTGSLKDSYRDFAIPMSSKLIGQTVGTTGEQFNAYLQSRFWSWYNANCKSCAAGFANDLSDGADGDDFANRYFSARVANIAGLEATATAVPRTYRPGLRQSTMPFDTAMALGSGDGRFAAKFGSGSGAEFTGQQGFGLQSDYDVLTGGANPFLGLASGAGYAEVAMRIGERVTVSTGVSRRAEILDQTRMTVQERQIMGSIDPYRATANTMTVAYRASDRLTTSLGYTMLNEDTGLLGVRSLNPNDLGDGTTTDAATFGADYAVARGLSLSMTGTLGRTRPGGGDQGIAVASGGLVSSAWQVAAVKGGVLDGQDRLRLTLAQPLHIEAGRVAFSDVAVVDRQTGELGEIVQTVGIDGGKRRLVAEALYGRSIGEGVAQVNLFGRADLGADERRQARLTLGGNFRLSF